MDGWMNNEWYYCCCCCFVCLFIVINMHLFLSQLSTQKNTEEDTTQAVMPSNKYSSAIMAESDKMTATVRVCEPQLQYKLYLKHLQTCTHCSTRLKWIPVPVACLCNTISVR